MRIVNHKHAGSGRSQRGVSTLVFVIFIFLLTVMATLTSFNFIRVEQKLSNNSGRAKQSFEAAEAGLTAALSYVGLGADRDGTPGIDPVFDSDADGIGDTASSSVGVSSVTVATVGVGDAIAVSSTGVSDDRSAQHTVSQFIDLLDPLPSDITNPLTSKSAINITGSATIHNPEGHSTIWSGDEVDLGSNNSTATQIPDVGAPGYPACMDTPMTCAIVDSSSKVGVGLDVIENDANLGNLVGDAMFETFFGIDPDTYRSTMVTMETTPANADADVQLATHEVIWIEGDTVFTNNTTVGCTVTVNGGSFCSNANTEASIVIIRGNVEFRGTPSFYGALYVIGNVEVQGNLTVVGAMVIDGTLTSGTGGSLDLWYNSSVLNNTDLAGRYVGVAGSWKDF